LKKTSIFEKKTLIFEKTPSIFEKQKNIFLKLLQHMIYSKFRDFWKNSERDFFFKILMIIKQIILKKQIIFRN